MMHFEQVRRILVIKLRHLGDVLLTTPVFHTLKKFLPNASIDAYIYSESLPMLEGHPDISQFLLYDRAWKKLPLYKRLKEEAALLLKIRAQGYDLVINLTEGDRGALAALISKAPLRVGFDPGSSGFLGKRKIFTHLVKNCHRPRHAVERNLDALRKMGFFPSWEDRQLDFIIPPSATEKVKQWKDFVAIHPVSRWRFKCLPPERMALLISELRKRGEKVILTSGPDPHEKALIEDIMKLVKDSEVISLAGELSLKELGALYLQARALITVDSVPLHIASALQVPVVALFGPTSEESWGPWRHPHARVVAQSLPCRPCHLDGCGGSKRSDCLDTLSIQEILRAYDAVLADSSDSASALLALNPLATLTTE